MAQALGNIETKEDLELHVQTLEPGTRAVGRHNQQGVGWGV